MDSIVTYACSPGVFLCALCLFFSVPIHAAPAENRNTVAAEAPTGVSLHVLPYRTAKRDSDTTYVDYLSGMPVWFTVRLVNGGAKWRMPGSGPIMVPADWQQALAWRIVDKDGNEVSIPLPESPVKGVQPTPAHDGRLPLLRNDLWGGREISAKDSAELNGEYHVSVSWGSIHAEKIVLRFRPPEGDVEKAYVTIRQAEQDTRDGNPQHAIELLESVIGKYGEMFGEGGDVAVLLLGHAFSEADNPRDALRCYSRYLEGWRKSEGVQDGMPMGLAEYIGREERKLAEQQRGAEKE